jgi:ABC-type spermidine/putrescine transport system permease subunit I
LAPDQATPAPAAPAGVAGEPSRPRRLPSARSVGRIGRRLEEYGGFVPAVLLFGGFFLVPFGLIVAYSFWRVVDYNVVRDWTLDNYRYFFSVPTYARTLWATVWVSAMVTVVAILLAFPFSYWLVRYVRRSWQKPLLVLVIVPLWASYLLRIYAWQTILGERGAVNRLLQGTGLTDDPVSFLLYNRPAVVIVLIYLYFPFAALTLYASLERFDWDLLKAAMDLGASARQAIWRILLPHIRPGIMTAAIFVFIPVLGEYLVPQLVGGTRGVMIGNLIANFFMGAQYTRGAAASLLIAALIVALLILFRRSLQVRGTYAAAALTQRVDVVSSRRTLTRAALAVYGVAIYFYLFAPIAVIILLSFNANRTGAFPVTGWTLQWYEQVFSNFQIQDALYTSLEVAAQVTLISAVVGTAAAFPLVRARIPFRAGMRVLMTLPIMIPGLLIGVSLLVLFTGAFDIRLSPRTAVIGQAVFTTPFVLLIVATRLEGFDRSIERAASDLGANTFHRLKSVVLPLIAPSVFAGALFAFTLSLDEFIITLFLIGGNNTLPIYIFTQIKFGITPEVNALAAMLLAASLTLLALAVVLPNAFRRLTRRPPVLPAR